MTTHNSFPWSDGIDCSITVCDTEGVIVYMNAKACAAFAEYGDLIGRNLFECHNARSGEMIRNMLSEGNSNTYTVEKNGVRKMFCQTPWRVGGKICGLVEISMELPADMPNYYSE